MTIPKKFGGPERPLIDAVLAIEQVARYCGVTARLLANNVMLPQMKEASIAKAYTGHEAFHVVSEALQMFGAAGYSRDLPLERMLRDVRMFQIGGGTSQAQLNMIARSIFPAR